MTLVDRIIWWFGVLHIAAYLLAAFTFAAAMFLEWIIRSWRLKREMLLAYQQVLKNRQHKGAVDGTV